MPDCNLDQAASGVGYIAYQNNMFTSPTLVASSELGDFVVANLLVPELKPGWRFTPDGTLEIDFNTQLDIDLIAIDRTHTFDHDDTITIYLSNVSYEIVDAAFTINIVPEAGEPIITRADQSSEWVVGAYQFVRMQFNDGGTPVAGYHEVNWLFIGVRDEPEKSFMTTSFEADPHEVVINTDFLGDGRTQKRSEAYRTYTGQLESVPYDDIQDIYDPLSEYAANGFAFFYCHDDRTDARQQDTLRVMKWQNAASYERRLVRNYIDEDKKELYTMRFDLKEVGVIGVPGLG